MGESIKMQMSESDDARAEALMRFLDWAEREASDLDASDTAMCIQIARAALLDRSAALH